MLMQFFQQAMERVNIYDNNHQFVKEKEDGIVNNPIHNIPDVILQILTELYQPIVGELLSVPRYYWLLTSPAGLDCCHSAIGSLFPDD